MPRPSPDEPALIARIVALATRFGRYGDRRSTALLRQEGWRVNHKRVERLWRQEGLRVPGKHPQRGRLWLAAGSLVRRRAERPSHVWSDDVVFDRTADGRPVRILAIVDAYTRECLSLDVARRLRSDDVLARLAQLFVARGPPTFLRSDNGPACTATAVRDWLHRVGVTTLFIEPGSPWENGDWGIVQRHAARRVPQSRALRHPAGSPDPHRGLAAGVQPDPPPQCPRLPPPRPGNAATPGTSHDARPGDRTNLTTGTTIGGRSVRLRPNGLKQLLRRLGRAAGIPKVHAHRFRHTFATWAIAHDARELDVQHLLGHISPEMVRRYSATYGSAQAAARHAAFSPGDGMLAGPP